MHHHRRHTCELDPGHVTLACTNCSPRKSCKNSSVFCTILYAVLRYNTFSSACNFKERRMAFMPCDAFGTKTTSSFFAPM